MDNQQALSIFWQEKHTETLHEPVQRELPLPESLPYLQRGDSSMYLDQFLAKNQPQIQPSEPQQPQQNQSPNQNPNEQEYSPLQPHQLNPSTFHNFQKHLTVCLKHAIDIRSQEDTPKDYQQVGAKLWKTFKQTSVSTKKILHYLLCERNEHKITEAGLKEYGLTKIYQQSGQRLAKQARKYLASQTLRQIREGKLEEYIDGKKLKDKAKFKKYVTIFVEELEEGFLKKRLPKEKVYELQH